MTLTKSQREVLYDMFEGRCAYCGQELPVKGWHADHIEPIYRGWWTQTGRDRFPERDVISNYFPACRPCNIDKTCLPLEVWRTTLQERVEVCRRNHAAFRSVERFGLVVQVRTSVVFYFETIEDRNKEVMVCPI